MPLQPEIATQVKIGDPTQVKIGAQLSLNHTLLQSKFSNTFSYKSYEWYRQHFSPKQNCRHSNNLKFTAEEFLYNSK